MDKRGRVSYLVAIGLALLIIAILLDLNVEERGALNVIIRVAALMAYWIVFLSIISSHYMRELVRYFGQSFVKIHHMGTITALILMTVHPVGVAIRAASLSVFVPVLASWYEFLYFGGRQALYLFLLAALVAWLRGVWKKTWRPLHWLAYLAFWFATAHGILIGANMGTPLLQAISIAMASATVAVFVLKRRGRRTTARLRTR
jgi:methionine sulfoxide reductase heme-binding subunit